MTNISSAESFWVFSEVRFSPVSSLFSSKLEIYFINCSNSCGLTGINTGLNSEYFVFTIDSILSLSKYFSEVLERCLKDLKESNCSLQEQLEFCNCLISKLKEKTNDEFYDEQKIDSDAISFIH